MPRSFLVKKMLNTEDPLPIGPVFGPLPYFRPEAATPLHPSDEDGPCYGSTRLIGPTHTKDISDVRTAAGSADRGRTQGGRSQVSTDTDQSIKQEPNNNNNNNNNTLMYEDNSGSQMANTFSHNSGSQMANTFSHNSAQSLKQSSKSFGISPNWLRAGSHRGGHECDDIAEGVNHNTPLPRPLAVPAYWATRGAEGWSGAPSSLRLGDPQFWMNNVTNLPTLKPDQHLFKHMEFSQQINSNELSRDINGGELSRRINGRELSRRINGGELSRQNNGGELSRQINGGELSRQINSSELSQQINPSVPNLFISSPLNYSQGASSASYVSSDSSLSPPQGFFTSPSVPRQALFRPPSQASFKTFPSPTITSRPPWRPFEEPTDSHVIVSEPLHTGSPLFSPPEGQVYGPPRFSPPEGQVYGYPLTSPFEHNKFSVTPCNTCYDGRHLVSGNTSNQHDISGDGLPLVSGITSIQQDIDRGGSLRVKIESGTCSPASAFSWISGLEHSHVIQGLTSSEGHVIQGTAPSSRVNDRHVKDSPEDDDDNDYTMKENDNSRSFARAAAHSPRFPCPNCGRSYMSASGLNKHKLVCKYSLGSSVQFESVDGGSVSPFLSCQQCQKVYSSLGALKMHIRTHTLPCQCPVCGKSFSRPWLLQGHLRTHTGERPFGCTQCTRAFADRSNLRAHLQTHSESKKYCCQACGKTFSRHSLLVKHCKNSDDTSPCSVGQSS